MADLSGSTAAAPFRGWLNVAGALVLVLATLADILDEVLGDLFHSPIQAEHGLLAFGLLHLVKSVVELKERMAAFKD